MRAETEKTGTVFRGVRGFRAIWTGRRLVSLACVAILLPWIATAADADEVLLKNGDRVTGEIALLKDGELHVKVPYAADPLKLKWGSIQALRSEKPLNLRMKDGSEIKGTVEITEEGFLRILPETTDPVVVRDLGSVHEINVAAITYKGNVTAGAGYTTGNTETASANLDGNFVARSKKQRLTLRGAWNYSQDDGLETTLNASGSIKYDFFPLKKLYTYVNSLLEYDHFQDLALRSTLGGGLGYQFVETSRTDLSFELGVSYVNEDFIVRWGEERTYWNRVLAGLINPLVTPPPDPDRSYAAGRWSANLDFKLVPGKINLFHFHEGYFGFEDLERLVIRSKQGMRFTILKGFFTSFQVNVDFNNAPANETIRKADTALILGLGYAFDL